MYFISLVSFLKFLKSILMFQLHGFSEKYQPSVNIAPKRDAHSGIRAFLKEISSKNNTQEPGKWVCIFT